ncbi:MAG TPA: penicillin-binding transpeptidase domain-containing protein, partial [Candidatus Baltobacteraceae bacterium]
MIVGRSHFSPWNAPWRVGIFVAGCLAILIVLIVRLIQVQVIHGAEYRAQAQANQIRLIPVAAPRGIIYDRTGKVLVRNRPSFVVGLIPSEVTDAKAELATLAATTGVPSATLWDRLLHHRGINYKNFDEVATYEPYGPVILASDLAVPTVARLSELLNDLPGVDLEPQPIRDYPLQTGGAHLFGYVGQITEDEYKTLQSKGYSPNDVIGKDGLESQYDQLLRGAPGGQRIVVDAAGQVIADAKLPAKPPVPGDSLITAVDSRLQSIVDATLAEHLRALSRSLGRQISGAVVVLDPWTGGVMALSSFPTFNPNDFAAGNNKQIAHYLLDPSNPLFDNAIDAATPTGSTFKMVTGTAVISEGLVRPNEVVYDSGGWNCGGY